VKRQGVSPCLFVFLLHLIRLTLDAEASGVTLIKMHGGGPQSGSTVAREEKEVIRLTPEFMME